LPVWNCSFWPRGASGENSAEGRGDNASDMDKCKCVADPVFFLQNGQYSAVPTADIIYRSDMEAAITSILQFLLPSGEAFTECDETDARIELLPVKGTNYLLSKLEKKHGKACHIQGWT